MSHAVVGDDEMKKEGAFGADVDWLIGAETTDGDAMR